MTTCLRKVFIGRKGVIERRKEADESCNEVRLPTNRTENKHKMALKTQKGAELPEGAVPLSSERALEYQWAFIKKWPSELEVFSLKFGRHIASTATFFSAIYLTHYFKKALNISNVRFLIAAVPSALAPTIISYYVTDRQITNSVLLMKISCPLCDQLYFGVTQMYAGVIFPALYGYFSMSGFAAYTRCYPVPSFRLHPKEFWQFTFKMLKKGTRQYQMAGIFQSVLVMLLPYIQNKQFINVMDKANQKDFKGLDIKLRYSSF